MSTYAIGDVQGCYDELMSLLDVINFDETKDNLWFAGDLVNRGENSLDVLRFIKNLGSNQKTVLGNHDLHLLAVASKCQKFRSDDTIQDVVNAPDSDELLYWLRHQELMYHDIDLDFVLVHAGISPEWDLELAKKCARFVEDILQSDGYTEMLPHLYGDLPVSWSHCLEKWEKCRFITNAFARMRYCNRLGHLNLTEKSTIGTQSETLYPWFEVPTRRTISPNIVFGHWAALNGITNHPKTFAVDTGCAWGHRLTAMRLEDQKRFSVTKKM